MCVPSVLRCWLRCKTQNQIAETIYDMLRFLSLGLEEFMERHFWRARYETEDCHAHTVIFDGSKVGDEHVTLYYHHLPELEFGFYGPHLVAAARIVVSLSAYISGCIYICPCCFLGKITNLRRSSRSVSYLRNKFFL
jgi:hypothetical protein